MAADLSKLIPPEHITQQDKVTVFDHLLRRLASYRNTLELYAGTEYLLSSLPKKEATLYHDQFHREIERWAGALLEKAWIICHESEEGVYSFDF